MQDVLPEVTFKKANPLENRVTIGGIVEFHLDIYIPPESIAHYEVEFQSNIDEPYKTTLCEARVISSGWNIPCVNGSFLETTYNSSTDNQHIDMAYIDAGVMTNMRLESEGLPVKYDKNQVNCLFFLNTCLLKLNVVNLYVNYDNVIDWNVK